MASSSALRGGACDGEADVVRQAERCRVPQLDAMRAQMRCKHADVASSRHARAEEVRHAGQRRPVERPAQRELIDFPAPEGHQTSGQPVLRCRLSPTFEQNQSMGTQWP